MVGMKSAPAFAVVIIVSITTLCGGCTSAEDKARIRQAVTAYNIASRGSSNSEALMLDLQKAVDAVPDGKARDEFLTCLNLLQMYTLKQQTQFLALERNLTEIGHGRQSTKKDFDIANAKAQKEAPLPDYNPIAKCAVVTLPSFCEIALPQQLFKPPVGTPGAFTSGQVAARSSGRRC
jgi:hypothetical protein